MKKKLYSSVPLHRTFLRSSLFSKRVRLAKTIRYPFLKQKKNKKIGFIIACHLSWKAHGITEADRHYNLRLWPAGGSWGAPWPPWRRSDSPCFHSVFLRREITTVKPGFMKWIEIIKPRIRIVTEPKWSVSKTSPSFLSTDTKRRPSAKNKTRTEGFMRCESDECADESEERAQKLYVRVPLRYSMAWGVQLRRWNLPLESTSTADLHKIWPSW